MADRDKVGIRDFFSLPTILGFCIGFMGSLLVFVIIFAAFDNTDEVNMRKALYGEISGDTKLESTVDDQKILNASRYFANYLKSETKKGRSVKEVISKSESYNKLFSRTSDVEAMQGILVSGFPEDTTEIVMGRNSAWHEIAKDPKSPGALTALLNGDTKNKEFINIEIDFVTNFLNKRGFFLLVIFSQMGAVWGFMWHMAYAYDNRYREERWFHLQWSKLGTHIFIMLLLPGALLPVFFAVLKILFEADLSGVYGKIKEKRQNRALEREKETALKFERFAGGPVDSRQSSQALLERLESRLKKEKAGA